MSGTSSGNARDRNRRWPGRCRICGEVYILTNFMIRTRADGDKTDTHELACERRTRLAAEELTLTHQIVGTEITQ